MLEYLLPLAATTRGGGAPAPRAPAPIDARRERQGVNAADVARARWLEHSFAAVGIAEQEHESLDLFKRTLGLDHAASSGARAGARRVDARAAEARLIAGLAALEPATLARVKAAVALDLELFEAARALFARELDRYRGYNGKAPRLLE